MSLINTLTAMPNRLAIACEYFASAGPAGIQRDAAEKQFSPLRREEGEDAQASGTTIAKGVIDELENLQLLVPRPGDALSLAPELLGRHQSARDWSEVLREIVLERLTRERASARYNQDDVSEALAWLLAQDPFQPLPKSGQHAELLRAQLSENDSLITHVGNDARFQNLLYWARYLGFCEWINLNNTDVAVPDPTRALEFLLNPLFEEAETLPVGRFVAGLAEQCDVFEGGAIRSAIEERMKSQQREENHFSRATSLALIRLEHRKVIQIKHDPDDSKTWILDLGESRVNVTSIRYLRWKQ